jgi:hypothetical protein
VELTKPLTMRPGAVNLDRPKANDSMFEYTKQILTKVSFDRTLFRKELIKALRILKREERKLLKIWCVATFAAYSDVVIDAFRKFSS